MKLTPPSPPLPPSHSSSSLPSNHPPVLSSDVIPAKKPKSESKSKSKSKPKSKKAKNPDKAQSTRKGSSIYRGVSRHRASGRFEAHIWDKNWQNPFKKKKGRQVYLGAFDDEADAARAHDLAALRFWGPGTILNFPLIIYGDEYKEMQAMTEQEVLASLRRRSSGFARGVSKYRGVARHQKDGRWEARLGQKDGYKYHYLGVYSTKEEAAQAYDLAALEFRGPNTVTNFESSLYMQCPRPRMKLPLKPAREPAPEPRVAPMEPTEPMDQTAPNECMMENSCTFGMDCDFGAYPPPLDVFAAYPPLDVTMENDWCEIVNNVSFEENIEHLFDGFEIAGDNGNGSDGLENFGGNENGIHGPGASESAMPGEAGPGEAFGGGHGISSELSFPPRSN